MVRTLLTVMLLFLGACASYGSREVGNAFPVEGREGPDISSAGRSATLIGRGNGGSYASEGTGGLVHSPGGGAIQPAGYVDARELRLKIRELGEQLVAGMEDCSLQDTVALPTSFVDLNDFERTSALGRLIAEQLYHELHQRGYAVREYRMPGSVKVRGEGEFALSRAVGNVASKAGSVVVVGTYQQDKEAVFINARLVRPTNGQVLRTASMILRSNDLTRRMARGGDSARLKKLAGGGMGIRDFSTAMRPPAPAVPLGPFDRGEDIH